MQIWQMSSTQIIQVLKVNLYMQLGGQRLNLSLSKSYLRNNKVCQMQNSGAYMYFQSHLLMSFINHNMKVTEETIIYFSNEEMCSHGHSDSQVHGLCSVCKGTI